MVLLVEINMKAWIPYMFVAVLFLLAFFHTTRPSRASACKYAFIVGVMLMPLAVFFAIFPPILYTASMKS